MATILFSELAALGFTRMEMQAYDEYVNKREFMKTFGKATRSDSERTKTYRAEHVFARMAPELYTHMSLAECAKFADAIKGSSCWQEACGMLAVKTVEVGWTDRTRKLGAGFQRIANARRRGDTGIITLQEGGQNAYTVIHEMAHLAGFMHHGAGFRQAVLTILGATYGKKYADMLKKCFKDAGLKTSTEVKIKPPAEWLTFSRRAQVARKARFG